MNGGGNGICLSQVADTKRGENGKQREEPSQDGAGLFIFESVFHSIHRAAGHFSRFIDFTVFNGQHTLAEFGCETKEG